MRRPAPLLALAATLLTGVAHAADDSTLELERLLTTPVYAASKYQQALADAPASVTVLTQGEIRAFGWRTLAEVLAGVRGLYTRYDRTYTYVGVRGLGRPGDYSSRLLLLVDGVRLNDNIYDSVLVGREFPLDVELIERVEFIPGPGSAVHGGNAVLGTINLITRDAASLRGSQAVMELDTQRGLKALTSVTDESGIGSLLATLSVEHRPGETLAFPEFDSPASPGGVIHGQDGEQAQRLFLRLNTDEFTWSALVGRRVKEIPNAPYGMVFGAPAESTDTLGIAGVTWNPELKNGAGWYGQVGVGRYSYSDQARYEPDQLLTKYGNLGVWLHAELNRTVRLGKSNLILLGLDAQQNQQQRITEQVLEPVVQPQTVLTTKGHRVGFLASDEISVTSSLKLGLGARVDHSTVGDWSASPRASLLWHPRADLVIKALHGRAYREPNMYERAAIDLSDNWNESLQRERVTSHELAAEWQITDQVRMATSIYRNDVTHMIEQVVDEQSGDLVYRNVNSARAQGVELEVEGRTRAGVRARASVARQRSRDHQGIELSNSPRWLTKLHATAPLGASSLRVAVELQGMSSRISETGSRIPSRLQTNVSLNWSPPASRWSAAFSVTNLLDRIEFDPTSTEFVGDRVEQDGREANLRIYLTF
jgi:outer membrane receptor protein involved in Fe transport